MPGGLEEQLEFEESDEREVNGVKPETDELLGVIEMSEAVQEEAGELLKIVER